MLSLDHFSNYLKQHDEKTFSANCFIEHHTVNMENNHSLTGVQVINFALCLATTIFIKRSVG